MEEGNESDVNTLLGELETVDTKVLELVVAPSTKYTVAETTVLPEVIELTVT